VRGLQWKSRKRRRLTREFGLERQSMSMCQSRPGLDLNGHGQHDLGRPPAEAGLSDLLNVSRYAVLRDIESRQDRVLRSGYLKDGEAR